MISRCIFGSLCLLDCLRPTIGIVGTPRAPGQDIEDVAADGAILSPQQLWRCWYASREEVCPSIGLAVSLHNGELRQGVDNSRGQEHRGEDQGPHGRGPGLACFSSWQRRNPVAWLSRQQMQMKMQTKMQWKNTTTTGRRRSRRKRKGTRSSRRSGRRGR